MVRVVVLLMLIAGQASAGAWPRARGETFLSFSTDIDTGDPLDSRASFYLERGLARQLTFGLDIGGDTLGMEKAIGFVRWPIGPGDRPARIALELGAGLSENELALRPGLSWGRGLDWSAITGWLSLETRAYVQAGPGDRVEADLTLGLNASARSKLMLQVQTGLPENGDGYVKLAPSWAYQFKPGRHIELGVTAGVVETDDVTIKLGLWREF